MEFHTRERDTINHEYIVRHDDSLGPTLNIHYILYVKFWNRCMRHWFNDFQKYQSATCSAATDDKASSIKLSPYMRFLFL